MNDLIKIAPSEIDGKYVQAVDARELHEFLESKQEFAHWIKGRVKHYGFTQGIDFTTFDNSVKAETTYINTKEYILTIDMAKEISMVERNEKGKQARTYFIDCERKAKAIATDPSAALNDPATMRGLLLTYSEKVLALESKVDEQAPKVAGFDIISDADGSLCITDAAKTLQTRPKDLFLKLSACNWIYRRAGGSHWIGYQYQLKRGTLMHKVTTVSRNDGTEKVTEQVRITPKGLTELAEKFSAKAA